MKGEEQGAKHTPGAEAESFEGLTPWDQSERKSRIHLQVESDLPRPPVVCGSVEDQIHRGWTRL